MTKTQLWWRFPLLLLCLLILPCASLGAEPQAEPVPVEEQLLEPAEDEGEEVQLGQAEPPAQEPSQPAAPATVTGGVSAAASETAAAVKEGGAGLAQQGRAIWREVLVPLWSRLAAAVPAIVKALVVLFAFWLLALVLSGLVRRLLSLTRADERAASDWGLGQMLQREDGSTRSIEQLVAAGVKWVILLFGLVAFFQALDLSMVAAPLGRVVDRIVGVIPNLLQAAAILAVYWILASVLRIAVERALGVFGFDQRASRFIPEREIDGETVRPSGLVARLVFYLVLVFGVAPFLDALGQRSLVAPLSEMLEKVLAFLPNLVGAVLIFFIGHLVAVVVREVLANLVAASGADAGARKLGLGDTFEKLHLSEVVGSVAYFFVIVPVVGAAVEALGIRAVSEPVSSTLTTLLAAIPLVFVAGVIVGLGYFLAKIVRRIVQSFLHGVGLDALPEKLGLQALQREDGRFAPSAVMGTAVMLIVLLLTAEQALATLQLTELSDSIARLIGFLPEIVVALALILVAWVVAGRVASLVEAALASTGPARALAAVARYAILFFGVALALGELGVGGAVISVIVAAVVGGSALAIGLAFGLGGRERAKELIERLND